MGFNDRRPGIARPFFIPVTGPLSGRFAALLVLPGWYHEEKAT
jgi:hypothetical protein